jgi:sRNA-binding protein
VSKLKFNNQDASLLASQEILKAKQAADKEQEKRSKKNDKATASHKSLPPKIKTVLEYLKILQNQFPIAFPKKARPSLKKQIDKDLSQKLNISKNTAKKFMAWYTLSYKYLQLHKAGMPRRDLDGNVVDHITDEQEKAKAEQLKSIWQKGISKNSKIIKDNLNEHSNSGAKNSTLQHSG